MTIQLTTREIRNVVTLLANGRGVDFAAAALNVPKATVREIHETYGPDAATLRRSSEQLLHQLDSDAGRAVPTGTPAPRAAPAPAPVTLPVERPPSARPAAAPRPPTPDGKSAPSTFQAAMVPVKDVAFHPSNLGRELGDLRDLTRSIKEHGVRVPVVLERLGAGRYRLRDGHRRIAAARLGRIARVPAIVHAQALGEKEWLLEAIDYNLRRQGYTDTDKRRVAHQLLDLGVTRAGVAQAFDITTTKLTALLADPTPDRLPAAKVHRPPSVIGIKALRDLRERWADADRDTILAELDQLLAPAEVS